MNQVIEKLVDKLVPQVEFGKYDICKPYSPQP